MRRTSRLPLGTVSVRQPAGRLGMPELRFRRPDGALVVPTVPRGRYVLEQLLVSLDDPLGLERVTFPTGDERRAARPPSDTRARRAVLGWRRPRLRRCPRIPASAERLRAPRRARVPGRGAAACRPLAHHRAPRQADGQGARRRSTGRCRRSCSTPTLTVSSGSPARRASMQLCELRARSSGRTRLVAAVPPSC